MSLVHLLVVPLLLTACAGSDTSAPPGSTQDATAPSNIVVCDGAKGPVDSGPARGLDSCQPGQICGHAGLLAGYVCCYPDDVWQDCHP